MVPKVLICWRDDCNDHGLRTTWLSQSSYNLPCSLIRFGRQNGSINQAVHPATAATFVQLCPVVFPVCNGIRYFCKSKNNTTTNHASLEPAVSYGLLYPPGTTLQNVFIWDSLSLSIASSPPPLNALLVYSLKFNIFFTTNEYISSDSRKAIRLNYDVEYLCCGDKL